MPKTFATAFEFGHRTLRWTRDATAVFCQVSVTRRGAHHLALTYVTPWVNRDMSQFNNYSLTPVLLVALVMIGLVNERL